jgi:hypothetical protein
VHLFTYTEVQASLATGSCIILIVGGIFQQWYVQKYTAQHKVSSYKVVTISGDYSFPCFTYINNANLDTWMLHVPLRGLETWATYTEVTLLPVDMASKNKRSLIIIEVHIIDLFYSS